jgi:hypothetical protein
LLEACRRLPEMPASRIVFIANDCLVVWLAPCR